MEHIEIEEKIKKENRKIILFAIIGIIEVLIVSFMYYQNWIEEKRESEYERERMEMILFNSAFVEYSGDSMLGSQIKNLIKEVHKSNRENEDRYVSIEGKYTDIKEIRSTQYYMVCLNYDDDGYIDSIRIEDYV